MQSEVTQRIGAVASLCRTCRGVDSKLGLLDDATQGEMWSEPARLIAPQTVLNRVFPCPTHKRKNRPRPSQSLPVVSIWIALSLYGQSDGTFPPRHLQSKIIAWPGRALCSYLTPDFVEVLLDTPNFLAEREVAGVLMVVPKWTHCLNYQFGLRKEAVSLARERGYPIHHAW